MNIRHLCLSPLALAAFAYMASAPSAYADISDSAYVESLYRKLLNRPSDPGGLHGWTNAISTGALSRQEVATDFLFSLEYRSNFVTDLYSTYLHRSPDTAGFSGWLNFMMSGGSFEQAIDGFVGSPEYFQVRSASSNTAFVEDLYGDLLGRGSDPGGFAYWTAQANGGMDRYSLAYGFLDSPEYRANFVNRYTNLFEGRAASQGEVTQYVGEINGGVRDEVIVGQIAATEASFLRTQSELAAVPEPSTWILMVTTLLGISLVLRRRGKAVGAHESGAGV